MDTWRILLVSSMLFCNFCALYILIVLFYNVSVEYSLLIMYLFSSLFEI